MKVEIAFRWEDMECERGVAYKFPGAPTPHMKKYRIPGVYRWAIFDQGGTLKPAYVGEAENFERRLKNYLKPGKTQHTSLRIRAALDEYEAQGRDIRFQLVSFDTFSINSCNFDCSQLADPFAREVIENLVVLEASNSGCKVLNKGIGVTQKKVELAVKAITETLNPAQKAELIKKLMESVTAQKAQGASPGGAE